MTARDIKQRAQELLTCDELRGRLPEEVQAFLRDIVALEPVAWQVEGPEHDPGWYDMNPADIEHYSRRGIATRPVYALGAHNDPA